MAFLSRKQIQGLGFKSLGKNVNISDKASFYNIENISIGNNVRIDDFCIISAGSAGISIGNYIHIACYCSFIGQERIELHDFSNVSSRVAIYSSNDDYSGEYLMGPCVPSEYSNVSHGPVILEKHTIIGAGSVLLPGVTIAYGTAIGALSLVLKSCDEKSIYIGSPAKRIKARKTGFEKMEALLLKKE